MLKFETVFTAVSAGAGMTRHIVMTHGGAAGGTPVRSGQILQVTGQGGQQHQIVVSQSGQIILNPNTAGMVMLLSYVVTKYTIFP